MPLSRLQIGTRGPCDWRSRLADPERQWQRNYSAFEAAVSWESAATTPSGIPSELLGLLKQQAADLPNPVLLAGFVEHKVALPGGSRASQNDLYALIRTGPPTGLFSLAVEAKAGEAFGEYVSDWLAKAEKGPNKPERLAHLLDVLGIPGKDVSHLRYQLLHRTVSALTEAARFGADHAAMIVQSFKNPRRQSAEEAQIEDFRKFAECLGAIAAEGQLVRVPGQRSIPLFIGWVTCDPATDAVIARLA